MSIRRGYNLGSGQGGVNADARPSSLRFVVPIFSGVCLIADLISDAIVSADFYARYEYIWFGICVGIFTIGPTVGALEETRHTKQWAWLPLTFLRHLFQCV